MQATIEIPDAIYSELELEAADRGTSVEALIVQKVQRDDSTARPSHVALPMIRSQRPGWLELDNQKISELVPFP